MKYLVLFLVTLASLARAELQPHGILNGGTNTIPVATTNYYGNSSSNIFICNQSSDITFEFSFTCTNANAIKVGDGPTFILDGAIDSRAASVIWQTNVLQIVVPNRGVSNVGSIMTNLPSGLRYPFYRVGQTWNTNISGTNFTGVKVRCFTKTGI